MLKMADRILAYSIMKFAWYGMRTGGGIFWSSYIQVYAGILAVKRSVENINIGIFLQMA